jgi:hypothetical protein
MSNPVDLAELLSAQAIRLAKLEDQSSIMLDVNAIEVYAVNPTGTCLVEAMRDGVVDHRGLVARLMAEFAVDAATAASDVDEFVEEILRQFGDQNSSLR